LRDCYRDAGLSNVKLELYPSGRHEMLHETNKHEVIANVVTWCDQTVAALS
jgi:alpha-beta hydrolase superfamily lysophospholipase